MDFMSYIEPGLLVLVPVLYALGAAIKHAKTLRDEMIPLLLGGAGTVLALLWVLGTGEFWGPAQAAVPAQAATAAFTAVVQGVLCAAAAVYAHQMKKQGKKIERGASRPFFCLL